MLKKWKGMFGAVALLLSLAFTCRAENAREHTYQPIPVAEGITAFIASESETGVVSGNCIAIVGDDGVLVVDSTHFPSHARKIIAEIKQMTSQPVRFLVHTHWHPDHLMGDSEFLAAFPGMAVVSTTYTQTAIRDLVPKYVKSDIETSATYATSLRKQAKEGKDDDGKPLTTGDKKFYVDFARDLDFLVPELKEAKLVVPNMGFENAVTIRLGKREVQLLFLGRGNTGGDAVIFVPDAKVVMTGDLLVWPTPYSYGSYPSEWVQTLGKVKALGATTIVPGHGPVERDNSYLDLVSAALQSVISQVQTAVKKGLSLEDTRKQVDLTSFQKKFAGDDTDRQIALQIGFVDQSIERAYEEAKFTNEE